MIVSVETKIVISTGLFNASRFKALARAEVTEHSMNTLKSPPGKRKMARRRIPEERIAEALRNTDQVVSTLEICFGCAFAAARPGEALEHLEPMERFSERMEDLG